MRARHPDLEDFVVRDGIKLAYAVYENAGPTVLLMPTWSIVHSRHWKLQVPYLARHFRVVTFDGRGNGLSDRPRDGEAYADTEFVADAVAVLDATGTDRAVVAGVSQGGHWTVLLAGSHPERVLGAVLICPVTALVGPHPARTLAWDKPLASDEGWAKYNRYYWQRDYGAFVEFFFSQALSEPHCTKQREDAIRWAHETDADTLVATQLGARRVGRSEQDALASISCPVLVIQGSEDRIRPAAGGVALAEATGGGLLLIENGGHLPHLRDPVVVNLAIRDFVDAVAARGRR